MVINKSDSTTSSAVKTPTVKIGEIFRVPDMKEDHAVDFPQTQEGTDWLPERKYHEESGRDVLVITNPQAGGDRREVITIIPLSYNPDKYKYVVDLPKSVFMDKAIKGEPYARFRFVQPICVGLLLDKVGEIDPDSAQFLMMKVVLAYLFGLATLSGAASYTP